MNEPIPRPIPRTMQVAISPEPGCVAVVEQPVPAISAGEVLLRMEWCGLCGTDVSKVYAKHRAGPVALGHEVVGTVVAAGAGVAISPGTRVVLAHHIPDYASHYTQRGSAPQDPHFKATNIDPCGFAQWIRASAEHVRHTLLPLPPHMPPQRGVFVEPLACCLRALDRMALLEGDTALLIGAGAAGLLFAPLLRDRAVTLLAADLRPARLALAEEWGAHKGLHAGHDNLPAAARAATGGRGADLVILSVADAEPWRMALESLRDGGTLLLFGASPAAPLPVDLYALWRREINVVSSYGATPDLLPRALALLAQPGWQLERTISHTLPLAEAPAAFALARSGQASKIVLAG